MGYTITQVSLDDDDLAIQAVSVLRTAFELKGGVDQLRKNTRTSGSQSSFYLAAMQGGEVIGFIGLIAHDLLYEGTVIQAYQLCWGATHPAHRGKSIFPNLILAAHEVLRKRGAAFIFGFPNSLSHPVFVKKLGYRQLPSVKWQMPHFPLAERLWLAHEPLPMREIRRNAIRQNDEQLIALKQGECGDTILVERIDGSVCWGIRRTRALGPAMIGYLDIGGIDLAETTHLEPLLRKLRRRGGSVAYTQLVMLHGASSTQLLGRVQPSASNPLIIHDIHGDSRSFLFDLMSGVRDVFT